MSQLYVPDGAFLVCTDGMSKQSLKVVSQSTVKIAGGKLAATKNDRMAANHNCAKMVVAGAFVGAIIVGLIAAATIATGGLAGAAIIGACAAGGAVAGAGVGLLAGLIPCICAMLTSEWTIYHPKVSFQKQAALLEHSTIPCFLGGTVMIFYSEAAANAAVNLKRKDTICNVGMIAVVAFASGLTGAFTGVVTAGRGLLLGFSQFGVKVGLANLGQMALGGGIRYALGGLVVTPIINFGKDNLYNAVGWKDDVTPVDTNIEHIEDGKNETGNNPDKDLKEATKVRYLKEGNQTSTYQTTSESKYEMYNIKGRGSEQTIGSSTVTESNLKSGAITGKTTTESVPQFNREIAMSDKTGYAEGGTRTQTTSGYQYSTNLKGAALSGVKDTFKLSSLGKAAAMSVLSDILAAIKNPIVKGAVEEFQNSLIEEEKAKAGITVKEEMI